MTHPRVQLIANLAKAIAPIIDEVSLTAGEEMQVFARRIETETQADALFTQSRTPLGFWPKNVQNGVKIFNSPVVYPHAGFSALEQVKSFIEHGYSVASRLSRGAGGEQEDPFMMRYMGWWATNACNLAWKATGSHRIADAADRASVALQAILKEHAELWNIDRENWPSRWVPMLSFSDLEASTIKIARILRPVLDTEDEVRTCRKVNQVLSETIALGDFLLPVDPSELPDPVRLLPSDRGTPRELLHELVNVILSSGRGRQEHYEAAEKLAEELWLIPTSRPAPSF